MSDTSTDVPPGNNTRFVRGAVVAALLLLAALVVLAGIAVSRLSVGSSNTTVPNPAPTVAVNNFNGMSDEDVWQQLVTGGDKYGISSMSPLERNMLDVVQKEIKAGGVGIKNVVDANKFVVDKRIVYWVILFDDKGTGDRLATVAMQVFYTKGKVGVKWIGARKKLVPNPTDMTSQVPADGLFTNR